MPFTGSESVLKGLIVKEMTANLPNNAAKPDAIKNLEGTADALSKAIVAWITGPSSINSLTVTSQANGVTGIPIALAPAGSAPVVIPVVTSNSIQSSIV